MAVAVQSSAEAKTSQSLGLAASSAIGAVFVLAAAALVLRGIPVLWESGVHQAITGATNSFISAALLILAQVGAVVGLIYVGGKLGSGKQATGIRGGILFMILVAFTVFFCSRAIFLIFGRMQRGETGTFGAILLILLNAVLLGLVVQFFRTGRFTRWSVEVDRQGWLSTYNYKRSQGLKVRRLTMLGLLLIAGTGIWTLVHHDYLPKNAIVRVDGQERENRLGDWVIGGTEMNPVAVPPLKVTENEDQRKQNDDARARARTENLGRPRIDGGFTVLSDLAFTIPLLLVGASLWFAWRSVNYPTFADFLIATEAEINKVSWTTRKALIRDTIVVLVCLLLLTLFLFVVDVFWNFLLSREMVRVLPTASERQAAQEQNQQVDPKAGETW
jgi:preprotein translocase SecE subunit